MLKTFKSDFRRLLQAFERHFKGLLNAFLKVFLSGLRGFSKPFEGLSMVVNAFKSLITLARFSSTNEKPVRFIYSRNALPSNHGLEKIRNDAWPF